MGIEHATLGTPVGRSNHSPMNDFQLVFFPPRGRFVIVIF